MIQTKTLLSTLGIAALAIFAACSTPTANTPAVNNSNTATVVNTEPKPSNTPTTPAVNAANNSSNAKTTPAAKTSPASTGEVQKIEGEYRTGKMESLILYVGMETGDYAAYCFSNDSETARAISAVCKNGDRCQINAEIGEGKCTVPGLEAELSNSGRIAKVISVKSLGPARKTK